jgi:hypothetical protein
MPETAGWAQVTPALMNDSATAAQFMYADIVAAFGTEDFATYLDNFNVGDTGEALNVTKVTIGTAMPDMPYSTDDRSNLVPVLGETDLGLTGETAGGWGQAVVVGSTKNEGGTLDVAALPANCVVTVYYTSALPPEIILQSWTDGAPETAGWAKVAPAYVNNSGNIAQFTHADMVAAFGTDDFATYIDNFNIGDTGEALTVIKVTVGVAAE